MEETRPGEYLPIEENERGTFIFNSRDLCMIEHIPELIDAGIDSFKIEGRMKTALYVATVARTYRKAIDDCLAGEEIYRKNMPWYLEEIKKCTYRRFTTGFYFGKPNEDSMVYDNNTYVNESIYLGIVGSVDEQGRGCFEQRNKFCVGDRIEIMKPDGRDVSALVTGLWNEEGEAVESAPHSKEKLRVALEADVLPEEGDLLRMPATQHVQ